MAIRFYNFIIFNYKCFDIYINFSHASEIL